MCNFFDVQCGVLAGYEECDMDAQRLVCAGMVLVILSLLDVVRQWVEILCWDRTPTVAPC